MKPWLLFLLLLALHPAFSQKNLPRVNILTKGNATSLRGLSVVNDRVVWACGSKGTVAKSTDGGKSWKWLIVKGFENRDFRDIEAFDATTAVLIAVDAPAYILKTSDGGNHWKVVYENQTKGMFLDALEFWNEQSGIVVGDPLNQKIFIARTFDGGSSWKKIPDAYLPNTDSGEAFFAASGTNVRILDKDEAVMVTGGTHSRIFIRNEAIELPIVQGNSTAGANSVAVMDYGKRKGGTTIVVVGGDFNRPQSDSLNCFLSKDRGKTWKAPKKPPRGYKSCVEYLSKKHLVTCGLTGVDYSFDGGQTWGPISNEGFHVCRIAKNGATVFLAGSNGKIAQLVYPERKR